MSYRAATYSPSGIRGLERNRDLEGVDMFLGNNPTLPKRRESGQMRSGAAGSLEQENPHVSFAYVGHKSWKCEM
jgi:hypothetical protein